MHSRRHRFRKTSVQSSKGCHLFALCILSGLSGFFLQPPAVPLVCSRTLLLPTRNTGTVHPALLLPRKIYTSCAVPHCSNSLFSSILIYRMCCRSSTRYCVNCSTGTCSGRLSVFSQSHICSVALYVSIPSPIFLMRRCGFNVPCTAFAAYPRYTTCLAALYITTLSLGVSLSIMSPSLISFSITIHPSFFFQFFLSPAAPLLNTLFLSILCSIRVHRHQQRRSCRLSAFLLLC